MLDWCFTGLQSPISSPGGASSTTSTSPLAALDPQATHASPYQAAAENTVDMAVSVQQAAREVPYTSSVQPSSAADAESTSMETSVTSVEAAGMTTDARNSTSPNSGLPVAASTAAVQDAASKPSVKRCAAGSMEGSPLRSAASTAETTQVSPTLLQQQDNATRNSLAADQPEVLFCAACLNRCSMMPERCWFCVPAALSPQIVLASLGSRLKLP